MPNSPERPIRDIASLRRAAGELTRLGKLLPAGRRLSSGLEHGLISAVSALGAFLPTQALGLREGFWAAITALAVAQTEFGAARSTARDQFTGAAIGGAVGIGTVWTLGQGLPAYAAAIVAAIGASWLVNVASAGRLAAITATIILIVPHSGSPERMLASRLFEVGWGVAVAIGVVWAFTRLSGRLRSGPVGASDRRDPAP